MQNLNILVWKLGKSLSSSSRLGVLLDSTLIQSFETLTHDVNLYDAVLATNKDLNNVMVGESFGSSGHRHITFWVDFNTVFNDSQLDSHGKILDFEHANFRNCITLGRIM